MKKIWLMLLILLFSCTIVLAAIPSKYALPEENKLKYFRDSHWWLRAHRDILMGTKYFYTPFEKDKLFSGIYYRFQSNELVMYDLIAKKKVSYKKLYGFLKSMGRVKKFQGIPYISSSKTIYTRDDKGKRKKAKSNLVALLIGKGQRHIIIAPSIYLTAKAYKGSLLEAHIKKIYQKKKTTTKKATTKKKK